jgi:ADP-ribose pyrophosphatase
VTDQTQGAPGPSGGPPAGDNRPAVDVSTPPAADGRPPAADDLTERVLDTELIYRGKYLDLVIETIERTDGSRGTREIVVHPGAVAIVALDPDDRVLLVRQFRLAAGRPLLELPAGTLDRDQSTRATEDPDVAARRELEEETGYRALRWQKLASFWTAPGFATELMHLYLATGLSPAHADRLGPDEDERLELERLPLAEAVDAVGRGDIADAKSIVGLLWLARWKAG